MKIKAIVTAVGAALYSAGALHAATPDGDTAMQLTAPTASMEEIKQWQTRHTQRTVMQNDGLNVTLSPRSGKFIEEDGLTGEHVYIIRLTDMPVSIAAKTDSHPLANSLKQKNTDPASLFEAGEIVSQAALTYQLSLLEKQHRVADVITQQTGRSEIRRQFTKAINGFSMTMTQDEARRVSEMPSVAGVIRSKNYQLLTDAGPELIEADQVWSGAATPTGIANKGEGQIIAVIDTGINTDHPSFADVGDDGYDHTNPWGSGEYVGDCAEQPEVVTCNDKLIGVRSYETITSAYTSMIPGWPEIGEDYNGHGSHVASTAAGNQLYNVDYMVSGFGEDSDGQIIKEGLFPQISGVAPHANIVSYQVCHATNNGGYAGCPSETLVAGIEDAIADGVDVINFSIGGSDSNVWTDPVQLAFLAAREAGISVAAAAGNSGTGSCGAECFGYIDNSSPWLAQVAATTHDREVVVETMVEYAGFVDPAFGSEEPSWASTGVAGGAINTTEMTGVVVWAKDYTDINGDTDSSGYCTADYPAGTFDYFKNGDPIPGAASGDTNVIVICQRHDPEDPEANARTAKIEHIATGGADGFIMFNRVVGQGTVPESYSLPGVHFTSEQWNGVYPNDGVEDWVDSYSEYGHMITLKETLIERRFDSEKADWLADFSSRGPSFSNTEILAPAISAPGVNIYAAYADEHPFVDAPYGSDFSSLSGTSMASPHIAGVMALLRQTHPDWTPAEIQSAMLMTADNQVQYNRLNVENGPSDIASTYRAGTGRVNAAKAVKAGLVMDESAENFLAANPINGGTPHRLNLPNLVDFSCQPECQWVRTVKATKDGSWTVTAGDVVNWNYDMNNQAVQNGVEIVVSPQSFELKAGETQSIVVKASVMDTQDVFSNSEVELHSALTFSSDDPATPDARWPMVFQYDAGDLPASLTIEAHEDTGSYQVNGVSLPQVSEPYTQVYAPVKATVRDVVLPIDDDGTFPWRISGEVDDAELVNVLDEATDVSFISVPENSKRLVVESLGTTDSELKGTFFEGNALIFVGFDYNNDGIAQPQDEILCVSNHSLLNNFCNINNPVAGNYWAIVYNPNKGRSEISEETFQLATAVVSDAITEAIAVTSPPSDGYDTVDLSINWSMEMEQDDIFYSVLDLGTSEVNPNSLGNVPLKLTRGHDRVTLQATQDKGKTGDSIPVSIEVMANNTGLDRAVSLTAEVPQGLLVQPGSVKTSNGDYTVAIEGQTLTITGTQADTTDIQPSYEVTSNLTDSMCKTPDFGQQEVGGYVDLAEFGILPALSGMDEQGYPDYRDGYLLPISALYNGAYDRINLYNNTEAPSAGVMQIRGNGMIDLTGAPYFFPFHMELDFQSIPYEVLAPLWRGRSMLPPFTDRDLLSVELSSTSGISLAATASGYAIIEWDNAADYGDFVYDPTSQSYTSTKRDNSLDFEVIINANTGFADGEYEIFYAYDNLDFGTTGGRGSIGIKGFSGPVSAYGPLNGFLSEQIAFDNLEEALSNDLVYCLDYVGPESSQFEVSFNIDVPTAAAGQTFTLTSHSAIEGMTPFTASHELSIVSNITLPAISDMTTPEETAISFDVAYADELNTANQVTVSGEHVTIEVEDSQVTLLPEQDFFGETTITVTVSDIENPADSTSTSFVLKVTNQQDAPVVVVANETTTMTAGSTVTLDASQSYDLDGDVLIYSWSGPGQMDDANNAIVAVSGLDVGVHEFTVVVSDGTDSAQAQVTVTVNQQNQAQISSKSGGTLAWCLSLLAAMTLLRRTKRQMKH